MMIIINRVNADFACDSIFLGTLQSSVHLYSYGGKPFIILFLFQRSAIKNCSIENLFF